MATPALLKIKVFWNKSYYVIYSAYDVTNKHLSHDSIYFMDVVMWPKFGSSSICIREVYHNLNFMTIWPKKTAFFDGWSWFKFNNLGLAQGTKLKFYTSLSKGLKLKVRKFLGLILTFVEVIGKKLVGEGPFCLSPPSWIGLKETLNEKLNNWICEMSRSGLLIIFYYIDAMSIRQKQFLLLYSLLLLTNYNKV